MENVKVTNTTTKSNLLMGLLFSCKGGDLINRLTQDLPTAVMVDGVEYPINTSSRNCLLILEAFDSDELLDIEKWEILLENFYREPYPTNSQKAFEMFEKFLKQCDESKKKDELQFVDFMQDSKYIYDALLSLGLSGDAVKSMHWWDFISRLAETKDTMFNRLVYLRMQKHRGKLTKEERAECDRYGADVIELRNTRDIKEKQAYDAYVFSKDREVRLCQTAVLL